VRAETTFTNEWRFCIAFGMVLKRGVWGDCVDPQKISIETEASDEYQSINQIILYKII